MYDILRDYCKLRLFLDSCILDCVKRLAPSAASSDNLCTGDAHRRVALDGPQDSRYLVT